MTIGRGLLLFLVAAGSSPARAADNGGTVAMVAPPARPTMCKSSDPDTVVVCGRSTNRYRIDPNVLAADRAADAAPIKPQLDATAPGPCTGSTCGGGDYIPLVGMALTALRAAELAADGDDWRDAFRTHPDQYRIYRQRKAEQADKGHVTIGVSARN